MQRICLTGLMVVSLFLSITVVVVGDNGAANTYYIRQAATGANNGLDWNNAWTDLPASLERGAVYYVAAGNYGTHLFNDEEVGTQVITIKKATVDDHGTAIGWANSFAEGQAVFTAAQGPIFRFTRGYYMFDGQTGERNSGHGIRVCNPSNGPGHGSGSTMHVSGSVAHHLTFEHVEIEGANWRDFEERNTRLLYFPGNVSNLTMRYCYIHDTSAQWAYISNAVNILIEYCYFENCGPSGMGIKVFGSSMNMNFVFRYNILGNVWSQNYMQLGEHNRTSSGGYSIYGNVFFMNDPTATSGFVIGNCSNYETYDVSIYNNTFVGLRGNASRFLFYNASDSNIASNNLWVDCEKMPGFGNIKDINNSKNVHKQNIFVNHEVEDFRLAIPIAGGIDLGNLYGIDAYGNRRGEDGVWDMGAYEYQAVDHPVAFIRYSNIVDGLSGYEPFRIAFDGSGSIVPDDSTVVSYAWDFGDGVTASGVNVEHTFYAGQHRVSLTITDNKGREDTREHVVRVTPSQFHNLYLYLPLNGSYLDASGKNMTISWGGEPTYSAGVKGQAAVFNQDNSRAINVSHNVYLDGLDRMTIAFWAKKNQAGSSADVLRKHGVYMILLTNTGMKATLWGSRSVSVEAKGVVADNNWHHYAVVYDGSTVAVYIDGVERSRVDFEDPIKRDPSQPVTIGRNPWGASLDGLMDEIRLYDKALSDGEVMALATLGNRPPVLTSVGNKTIVVGSELNFSITATDEDGDSLSYSATAAE